MYVIQDNYNRKFPYLRLSITELCNFRCTYCLPDGCKVRERAFLTLPEIRRLVEAFAALGVNKVRLTGGEPTLRKDFTEIVKLVATVPGINKVTFTTNGYRLLHQVKDFYAAGLRAINVSVDSLDAATFHKITGHNCLNKVLAGINAAKAQGFTTIKVNAVLLKDLNHHGIDAFLSWVKKEPISMRFIELMQTSDNYEYFQKHHLSTNFLRKKLLAEGWQSIPRAADAGPAEEFIHADFIGRVGIIAPYSKDFCVNCNRLRISARGDLHFCLFTDQGYSLRSLLQQDQQKELLQQKIIKLLTYKKASHFLHQGLTGVRSNLATIGG